MESEKYTICNKCSKVCFLECIESKIQELRKTEELPFDFDIVEAVKISHTWGYFSNKDQERQTFFLCEKCWDTFLETFKKSPDRELIWANGDIEKL